MKVKFVPQNIELEIQPDQTIKDLADKNGIYIKSICNGLPSCSECRIKITEGEYNVLPPGIKELSLIGTGYFIDQRRLSCQVKCFGDVTVDLSEQIEKEKNIDLKRPQGSRKTEVEVSHALTGNLLEQENVLKEVAEERPVAKSNSHNNRQNQGRDRQVRNSQQNNQQRPNQQRGNQQKNNQQRNGQKQGGQSGRLK